MHGRIPGIVVPPALLVPEVGCELIYFSDDERPRYRIAADAIGALDADERWVLIHEAIETPGREAHTIGEEIGHAVLHAKLISPEQQALGLEIPAAQGIRRFTRTEQGALNDERPEPVWMSMEAGYFSACLMMPRDRYGPVAERRLREAVSWQYRHQTRPRTIAEKVALGEAFLKAIRRSGLDPADYNLVMPGVFDNGLIDFALDLLQLDHQGNASKAAQRRRLVELGLVRDASAVLTGHDGERLLPRFEFLFVADHVVESARSATSNRPAEAGSAGSGVGV
jgi:hypothetical protein